jgi:hypothetical protein
MKIDRTKKASFLLLIIYLGFLLWPTFVSASSLPSVDDSVSVRLINGPPLQTPPARLSLPSITASNGQSITMDLTVDTTAATRGIQFAVSFNPAVLRCEGVTEGNFYSDWANANNASSMVFPSPSCNNTTGTISDMGILLLGGPSGGPTGTGVIATLRFTVLSNAYSPVNLVNVQMSDAGYPSQELPTVVTNGAVNAPVSTGTPTALLTHTATRTLSPSPTNQTPVSSFTPTPSKTPAYASECANADVNRDGVINVLDLTSIGSVMGKTGAPGWIPEDVNRDGVVSVLDLTLVGSCMYQTTATLTPTPQNQLAQIWIEPNSQTIAPQTSFTVRILLNTHAVASRSAQAGLKFNPQVLRADLVEEGNFYRDYALGNDGATLVYPLQPSII